MTSQHLSVEEFNQLLQQWNGETIKISKQELQDYDQAILELDSISYSKDTRRLDGYEPMHTLQLNGSGKTLTDDNQYKPLPSDYYEIPLEDSTQYTYHNSQFSLKTDRGEYIIELTLDT
ncbi:hypothetical protein [Gracilibacillus sp. YIM 98692]|uniref:hypothetical protein n=1 Tax=Gracilibacillus sp. YIM 98692 TaxID=2663532 RepID=UPI0013D062B9|nr:hypothetical protein [Gracilibacillus sp. YIM 98692]